MNAAPTLLIVQVQQRARPMLQQQRQNRPLQPGQADDWMLRLPALTHAHWQRRCRFLGLTLTPCGTRENILALLLCNLLY